MAVQMCHGSTAPSALREVQVGGQAHDAHKVTHWFLRVSLGSPAACPTAFLGRSVLQLAWLVACSPCVLAWASALGCACWLFGRFGPLCNTERMHIVQ
jgi:hypothetical protein